MAQWNLWHGCQKISPGCANCYVYRGDSRYDRKDSFIVRKNAEFDLPIRKNRQGEYKLRPSNDYVYTCFTSDFFIEDADEWRAQAWKMIKERPDLNFFIITKRINRFNIALPSDWGDGYENVTIGSTAENQNRADYRLPIFNALPIKHKHIICEPILERIDLSPYLSGIEQVCVGGESGEEARLCHYSWVLDIRRQCLDAGVSFYFKQTGAKFVKDGVLYNIPRRLQCAQARKSGISTAPYFFPHDNE